MINDERDISLNEGGRLLVVDLDLTALIGEDYDDRWLSRRCKDAFAAARQAGNMVMVSTARPPMTAFDLARRLGASACAYHNGGVVDLDCAHSSIDELADNRNGTNASILRFGIPVERCVAECRRLLAAIPKLRLGIELDDTRYVNFDLHEIWPKQGYTRTDFSDMTAGIADKVMAFPTESQKERLRSLVPDDLSLLVSEDVLWLLMNPKATKLNAMREACRHFGIPMASTIAFGDDLIDMEMLEHAGHGVAVANARPEIRAVADEVCPSCHDDGVAQWIEHHL
ncbi:HAD hydrolase family protein [Bifidobacterium sp. ESL0763]|uniref:HAD hydrolase family protein n=1 Tax=Bifidobacterium sp. ESL0763 TaxID=2983227 RepID=UPI0023F9E06B|nr:HAD hydrolase family protein [Bifidobacterium sp. ESL0763]MDF7663841.1 HAD hydrolase family protein [Bifidobacterium sp. ESL0763]